MSRGKYANASTGHRQQELLDRIASLEAALAEAKAEIRQRDLRLDSDRAAVRKELAGRSADFIQNMTGKQVDELAQGVAKVDVLSMKVVMTQHLFNLFLTGVLDWDRLRGDVAMLSFLAVHGDLREWWRLVDEYVWIQNRSQKREAARRDPLTILLLIDSHVARAFDPQDRAAPRIKRDREALDAYVIAARDRYLDGDGPFPLPSGLEIGPKQ